MGRFGAFFLVLSVFGTASAQDFPSDAELDSSEKGAVLCIHAIVATAKLYAEYCQPERIAEIARLENALKRFEAFEVKNSDWTPEQAAAFTRNAYDGLDTVPRDKVCQGWVGDSRKFLIGMIDEYGGENSAETVDDILSVPRKPLMNPCL